MLHNNPTQYLDGTRKIRKLVDENEVKFLQTLYKLKKGFPNTYAEHQLGDCSSSDSSNSSSSVKEPLNQPPTPQTNYGDKCFAWDSVHQKQGLEHWVKIKGKLPEVLYKEPEVRSWRRFF